MGFVKILEIIDQVKLYVLLHMRQFEILIQIS